MELLLIIIFVISAIILCFLVLIQDDQGEGIGSMFGGGSTTAFGSRSGNILTRATTLIAILFIVSALGFAWLTRSNTKDDLIEQQQLQQQQEELEDEWKANPMNFISS